MITSYPALLVVLTRTTDTEGYPYFVEAQITDAHGKTWVFLDKLPIFTSRDEPVFPSVGRINCTVEDEADDPAKGKLFLISTEKPDGICTERGEPASFWVFQEQVVFVDDLRLEDRHLSPDVARYSTNTGFKKSDLTRDATDDPQ